MKFGVPMQNEMRMTTDRSTSKPEVEFQMAAVRFTKPEVVITQPWLRYLYKIWYT